MVTPITGLPQEPDPIRRLEEGVVNRIAAGEVIQRPANAVKEMLENSLDAGATQITITLKEGGVKSLQVQDNGHGVRRSDLGILCERHTTSKLRTFEDLLSIETLGFRGEALASISYVAHVSVTTMTVADATHGWRATYRDGVMEGGAANARPCAATPGTTITAEDLFYNVPLRRKALRPASEEYAAVLDVVGRYAVYHAGASVTVKRQGEARSDLHTQAGATRAEAIRAVFGAAVAKNLLPLAFKRGAGAGSAAAPAIAAANSNSDAEEAGPTAAAGAGAGPSGDAAEEEGLSCEVSGFVTGADYAGRKTQLVLFINGRAVGCGPLKRALEATYTALLPKAAKPFAFLDVRLPPHHVDVNVHPTKREVAFLHQEGVIEAVREEAEAALLASNAQRTFTQTRLTGAGAPPLPPANLGPAGRRAGGSGGAGQQEPASYYRPDRLVRTDARTQTLHAFLGGASRGDGGMVQEAEGAAATRQVVVQEERNAGGEFVDLQAVAVEADGAGSGGPTNGEPQRNAAAAAAAAQPAARRPRGGAEGYAASAPDDDFSFMPTAMEIGGAAAAAAGPMPAASAAGAAALEDATSGMPVAGSSQAPSQQLHRPVRHRSNPANSAGLESVERLLAEAERSPHSGLADVLKAPIFVGMADCRRALLQSGTRLYLADLTALSHDMFYQQVLRRFGQAPRLRLRPPLPVRDLAMAALQAEEAAGRWRDTAEGGSKEEVADLLHALLLKKADILRECFSVDINDSGCLAALPQLIEQYAPRPSRLPSFVLALGQKVEWSQEGGCFESLAGTLAELFQVAPEPGEESAEEAEWSAGEQHARAEAGAATVGGGWGSAAAADAEEGGPGGGEAAAAQREHEGRRRRREWAVEHVVLPALRLFLVPGKRRGGDGSVVELTRLEQLYRVFERC